MLHRAQHHPIALVTAIAVVIAVAGCSTGGGSRAPIPGARGTASATVSMSIALPVPGSPVIVPRRAGIRPAYVSTGTTQIAVYVNGAATPTATFPLPNPSSSPPPTYEVSFAAPYGNDTFQVDLLDSASRVLSRGTTTQTIVAGTNTVDVTALGIPAFAVFRPADAAKRPPVGAASQVPLNLIVADAAGYAISGTFLSPVALSVVTPATAGYTLTSTSVASSSAASAVALNYDGTTSLPARVIAALASGSRDAVTTVRPGGLATGSNLLVALNAGSNNLYRIDASSFGAILVGSTAATPTSLAASPYGRVTYVALQNGAIAVYDGASRSLTGTLPTSAQRVSALSFSDDGRTAYALLKMASSYAVAAIDAATNTVGAPVAVPPAATSCNGIASTMFSGVAMVSCDNDAQYRIDTTGSTPAAKALPNVGGPGLTQALPPFLTFFTAPSSHGIASYAVSATGVGSGVYTPISSGPASIDIDPAQQTLYVGASGVVLIFRANADWTVTPLRSVPLNGLVTAVRDYPGGIAGEPDATLWSTLTSNAVVVVDLNTLAVQRTVSVPGLPIAAGFVP